MVCKREVLSVGICTGSILLWWKISVLFTKKIRVELEERLVVVCRWR